MSHLQRSAMNARLAKLPGYIPNVYTPTVAPGSTTEDENAEEMEEAMSSIGQLPSMAPPKVRKYVSNYTTTMLVTDTSIQSRVAPTALSGFIRFERVRTDLRRESLYAGVVHICGCRGARFPCILYAPCGEGG